MAEIVVPSGWRERLQNLAGRRRQTWVLAVFVGTLVIVAVALWSRGAPATIAPPAPYPEGASTPGSEPGGDPAAPVGTGIGSSSPGDVVLVHVAGAVRRPGLYEIPADGRIADAVKAANGPTKRAYLDGLNLAELLSDGQKIEVPTRKSATSISSAPSPLPSTSVSGAPTGVVDLNTADQLALEAIPGIGPVTATAILDYRSEIGSFTSVDELLDVSGIGPATLEEMRPYVTV